MQILNKQNGWRGKQENSQEWKPYVMCNLTNLNVSSVKPSDPQHSPWLTELLSSSASSAGCWPWQLLSFINASCTTLGCKCEAVAPQSLSGLHHYDLESSGLLRSPPCTGGSWRGSSQPTSDAGLVGREAVGLPGEAALECSRELALLHNYKHREINCRRCHCVGLPKKALACSCSHPFHGVPPRPILLHQKRGQNNTIFLHIQSTSHFHHKIIPPYNTITHYHVYYSALWIMQSFSSTTLNMSLSHHVRDPCILPCPS